MIIKEYRIKRIANSNEYSIAQWQIQLWLVPTWFERTFLGRIFTEHRTMIGRCITWKWGDGSDVGYFWKSWAFDAVRKRINKAGGTTYVNRRSNRQEDE